MLTKRDNLMETICGGNPDRFVNQFEAFAMVKGAPFDRRNPSPRHGEVNVVNAWGITRSWVAGTPGAFPVHDPEHIVCKDVTEWKRQVVFPKVSYPDSEWDEYRAAMAQVDRKEQLAVANVGTGLFELCHYLMEIQNCLMAFYEEPESMQELIDALVDWHMSYAEQICHHVRPDAVFFMDDWGTQISTFISPDMFREFFLPGYKAIYGYYKEHGVELVIHHSDTYAATLVPQMVEMGIDIWQGVMDTNPIPELIRDYGKKLTFMGGINSASIDRPDWTREMVRAEAERACMTYGKLHYIPNATRGGAASNYPGVYDALSEEIDAMSRRLF